MTLIEAAKYFRDMVIATNGAPDENYQGPAGKIWKEACAVLDSSSA